MRDRGHRRRRALLIAALALVLTACSPSDHPYSVDPGEGWGARHGGGGGGNR